MKAYRLIVRLFFPGAMWIQFLNNSHLCSLIYQYAYVYTVCDNVTDANATCHIIIWWRNSHILQIWQISAMLASQERLIVSVNISSCTNMSKDGIYIY